MSESTDPIRLSVPPRSAAERKKKLGRGLGALMGEAQREEPLAQPANEKISENRSNSDGYTQGGLSSIPVSSIVPLPGQPRKRFDEAALEELAASIAARGVIQPIIVTANGEGRFQLVAGERRWRAAGLAGLHEVPVVVREASEQERLELAIIENLQREDLNPIEEARALDNLMEVAGYTHEQLATRLGKDRSTISNALRLLKLPTQVQDLVQDGALSMGHARA